MKISIVTLKHYRRPRPGSKKGQPRGRIPSWEGFCKACKEAWEATELAEENRRRAFQNLPPVVPQEKRDEESAWLARVEELKAQVSSLQEHNTKEVERRRALKKEFDGFKARTRYLVHSRNVGLSEKDGKIRSLEKALLEAQTSYAECLADLKDSESARHKKSAESNCLCLTQAEAELIFGSHCQLKRPQLFKPGGLASSIEEMRAVSRDFLAEERKASKELREQLAKANALNDSLSSQAVNLADKVAKLRGALESVEWHKVSRPYGFGTLTEIRCPSCNGLKSQGHELSCSIGKALTTL